jgi:hypothetical protein
MVWTFIGEMVSIGLFFYPFAASKGYRLRAGGFRTEASLRIMRGIKHE